MNTKMKQIANTHSASCFIVLIFMFLGCSPENIGNQTTRSDNNESLPIVSSIYTANGSLVAATSAAFAISSVNLTLSNCRSSSNGQTFNYTFATSTNGIGSSSSNAFYVTPNDTPCTLSINSVVLSSNQGYANSTATGIGSGTYAFSGASVTGAGAYSTVFKSVSSTVTGTSPSFIYISGKFSTARTLGTAFRPTLQFQYGENINNFSGDAKDGYGTGISLNGTNNNGNAVLAPTYCFASGTFNQPCISLVNATSSNFLNSYYTSGTSAFILSETLTLMGANSSLSTTVANATTAPAQGFQEIKIIGLGNFPLVSGGVYYTTLSNTTSTNTTAPVPANSNCGVITSATSDTSGCTYNAVNVLWNNSPTIITTTDTGGFIQGATSNGVASTYVYYNYASSASMNIATNATSFTLQFMSNFNIPTLSYEASSGLTRSYATSPTIPAGLTWTGAAYLYSDLYGYYTSTTSFSSTFNTFGNYNLIPSKTSQSAIRYLILKRTSAGVPAYQLFILNTGL